MRERIFHRRALCSLELFLDRRYRSAAATGAWPCVLLRSSAVHARATGVTWSLRTASAPWAGRFGHTAVADAAGAIYVIGGHDGRDAYYNDAWASTDGGAD